MGLFDEEETGGKKDAPSFAGENLERLSLHELRARVEALQAEIARTESEIVKKEGHAQSAASFFKTPGGS